MNGWDALQAYDLVNNGHGGYGFHRPKASNKGDNKELIISLWTLFKLDREAKRLAYEEGLTGS